MEGGDNEEFLEDDDTDLDDEDKRKDKVDWDGPRHGRIHPKIVRAIQSMWVSK